MLPIVPAVIVWILVGLSATSARTTPSQNVQKHGKTVWDGVYTVEQAARGKGEYEDNCAVCHTAGEAPSLLGDAFLRRWFEDNLNTLFTKMQTEMPLDAPGSLPESAYVDIVTFLLAASGFPAGASELSRNPELLASISIVDKGGPGGSVPNFSLVQVMGCLTQRADKAWILTNSTEPVRTRELGDSTATDLDGSGSAPLGSQIFQLLDFPLLGRETRKGHKVQAKGFLIRQPKGDDRLNLTSLQTLAESCP